MSKRHRSPRPSLSKRPSPDNFAPDLDGLLYLLRDNLRRADAFITTAEQLIEQPGSDADDEGDDGGIMRYRMRIEYLVEAAKMAVRAANYTGESIDAEISARKRRA